MALNYRTQLSYGTLLAVVFCRPSCQIHFQTYFQKVTYSRQHTLITQLQIKMLCTKSNGTEHFCFCMIFNLQKANSSDF